MVHCPTHNVALELEAAPLAGGWALVCPVRGCQVIRMPERESMDICRANKKAAAANNDGHSRQAGTVRQGNVLTGRMNTLPPPTEAQEQEALFERIYRFEGRYPQLLEVYHVPNGGARPAVYYRDKGGKRRRRSFEGERLLAQGVRKGRPDINCDVACIVRDGPMNRRGHWHGLRIEMKRPGEDPTPEQVETLGRALAHGYLCLVCYSADEAWRTICDYLGIQLNADGAPVA